MTGAPSRERNLILSQIWDLMQEHGADLSMDEIASALNIGGQLFQSLFTHRSDMFVEVCDWKDSDFSMDISIRNVMAQHDDAVEMFYKTMEIWYPYIPDIYPVASEFIRLKSMDPDINQAWQTRMKTHWNTVYFLAQCLRNQNQLKSMWSPEKAADFLWVHSSVQTWALFVHDRGWTPKQAQTQITNTMAFALLNNPKLLYAIDADKAAPQPPPLIMD